VWIFKEAATEAVHEAVIPRLDRRGKVWCPPEAGKFCESVVNFRQHAAEISAALVQVLLANTESNTRVRLPSSCSMHPPRPGETPPRPGRGGSRTCPGTCPRTCPASTAPRARWNPGRARWMHRTRTRARLTFVKGELLRKTFAKKSARVVFYTPLHHGQSEGDSPVRSRPDAYAASPHASQAATRSTSSAASLLPLSKLSPRCPRTPPD